MIIKKSDLVDFFIKYNTCINKEFINFKKKDKQDLFNINLRVGLNNSSLSTGNTVSAHKSRYPDFDSQIGLRAGIEAEFVMPFNRNKWAIIVEPTYQSFNVKGDDSGKSVDYSSIELPIGVRHYMFINEKSKIFINGSFIVDFSNGKALGLDIKTGGNLGFGVGYKRNDKLSLEFRYHTSRNLFYNFLTTFSNYNTMSLILGYTLF